MTQAQKNLYQLSALANANVSEAFRNAVLEPGGCVLLLDPAEAGGTRIPDLSGAGNHGTISTATQYDVLCISGGTTADGVYQRIGIVNNKPYYRRSASPVDIWWDSSSSIWRISATADVVPSGSDWRFDAGSTGPLTTFYGQAPATGTATVSDPSWKTLTVSGTTTPSAIVGDYELGGIYGGRGYYKHVALNYWIYWTGAIYRITDVLGSLVNAWFNGSASLIGSSYGGVSGSTGTATVSGKVASSSPGSLPFGVTLAQPGPTDGLLSAKFDGVAGKVTVSQITLTAPFTLTVLVNASAYVSSYIVPLGGSTHWFGRKSDGEWKLVGNATATLAGSVPVLNQWRLLNIVSTGTRVDFFSQGVLAGSVASAVTAFNLSLLGAGSTYFFNGIAGSAAAHSKALNPSQVLEIFNAVTGG